MVHTHAANRGQQWLLPSSLEKQPQTDTTTLHCGGCFVAGTLVHTNEGLRPIEQIKVGDYVLSKPESGTGELSYKRVSRTFAYDDKEVFFVSWNYLNPATNRYDSEFVVVTGEHPFFLD